MVTNRVSDASQLNAIDGWTLYDQNTAGMTLIFFSHLYTNYNVPYQTLETLTDQGAIELLKHLGQNSNPPVKFDVNDFLYLSELNRLDEGARQSANLPSTRANRELASQLLQQANHNNAASQGSAGVSATPATISPGVHATHMPPDNPVTEPNSPATTVYRPTVHLPAQPAGFSLNSATQAAQQLVNQNHAFQQALNQQHVNQGLTAQPPSTMQSRNAGNRASGPSSAAAGKKHA